MMTLQIMIVKNGLIRINDQYPRSPRHTIRMTKSTSSSFDAPSFKDRSSSFTAAVLFCLKNKPRGHTLPCCLPLQSRRCRRIPELAASAIPTGLTAPGSSWDGHGCRWLMLAVCRLKSEYIKQLHLRADSQGLESLGSGAHRRWIDSPEENAPRRHFP